MILFKRVGESLGQIEGREWALLVLETLGVLAGIFIAFELNEWATRKSIQARQREVLERLLGEAEETVAQLRSGREWMRGIDANERKFVTELTYRGNCPAESLWSAPNTVTVYPPITVPTSVYEEMMGAGGLSIIPNPQLRRAVSDFHATLRWASEQNGHFLQVMTPPLPSDDPRLIIAYHPKPAEAVGRVKFDPQAQEPEVVTFDRAALCADHGFRNRMADAVRNHGLLFYIRMRLTEKAIGMCAAIAQELGQTCTPSHGDALAGNDAELAARAAAEVKAAD